MSHIQIYVSPQQKPHFWVVFTHSTVARCSNSQLGSWYDRTGWAQLWQTSAGEKKETNSMFSSWSWCTDCNAM